MKHIFTVMLFAFTLYTGLAHSALAEPHYYISSDEQQTEFQVHCEFIQHMRDLLYELPLSNANKNEIYRRSLIIARKLGVCLGTYLDELVAFAAINAPHDLIKFLRVTKIPLSKELQKTYCKKLSDLNDLEEKMLHAVLDNDLNAVRDYLLRGARVNGQYREPGDYISGFTILVEAATEGASQNMMTLLLSQLRIDVNACNHHNTTAIMLGAWNNSTDAVLVLRGHPALKIQAQDDEGRDALALAQLGGHKTLEVVLSPDFVSTPDFVRRIKEEAVNTRLARLDAILARLALAGSRFKNDMHK